MATASGERTAIDAVTNSPAAAAIDVTSDTPNVETPAYQRMLVRSAKCRDLMEGVDAIRRGGETYLPKYTAEGTTRYNARRTIAALFNGFKATVKAAVGMLLQSPPVLGEDMPEALVKLSENVDGQGTHVDVFTARLAKAGLVDGLAGIITDYPRLDPKMLDLSKISLAGANALKAGEPLDGEDERALGLRPYFLLIKSDQVLLPVYEVMHGLRTLVLLVLRETATERQGRFGLRTVVRYRVYIRTGNVVTYERWTETNGTPARDEGPTVVRNITAIPWSPLAVGEEVGPNEYVPPLMDLAELNIEHHRIKSGLLSLEERAFVPTPVRVGAMPNSDGEYPPINTGPGDTIEAPYQQGVAQPFYWTAPPVEVLEPGMKSLETCKAEMGAMGMNFLSPDPKAQETATANRADNDAERVTISTMGRAVQDCLESAYGFAAQFLKLPSGSVTINREFEQLTMDAQLMTAYAALAAEGFPKLYLVKALQAGGRVDPDTDPQDIVDAWDKAIAEKELRKRVAAQLEADQAAATAAEVGRMTAGKQPAGAAASA